MKTRLVLTILTCLFVRAPAWATDSPSPTERIFALQVQPLLRAKCLGCHGEDPDGLESGFDVRTRAALLRGGEEFGNQVLLPGDAAKSLLLSMVRREHDYVMPPKEAERLTAAEIAAVSDWIRGGAPWPSDDKVQEIYRKHAPGVTWPTSGGLGDDWTNRKYKTADLWAYQPLRIRETGEDNFSIDRFVEARLEATGIEPAPLATRQTLIRRATFDLLGLPPTPTEVQQFVDDPREDTQAFAALIDRLLTSPHYGEQWGRYWLDVVRYADSSGFANDWERPNAWRYRDYVIRSFNGDKPYDQFVREQLAGDEIHARRKAAGEEANASLLLAPGFLRMGPWEQTGMSVAKVTRQQFLDDVTDTVGQVFLGHALQCCRCHDHKFDPLPTRDYYAIQAVFATTQFADVDAAWLPEENRSGMADDERYLKKRQQVNNPPGRVGKKWKLRFAWELDRYKPIAFSVQNGQTRLPKNVISRTLPSKNATSGQPATTHILTGGDVFSPAAEVSPGVLSAVPDWKAVQVPTEFSGRRTALADWVADPNNPLTARVIVNRIWQHHFGQGIAGNPNNFGATGKKPTHPKLLDWLANDFIKHGWSIKRMHRTIMLSDTYRRTGAHPIPTVVSEKDPTGSLYAVFRPRRLTAEEIRDAMLACSGELNREQGGIPIRPDMNMEAALQPRMIMGTYAPSYVPNPKPAQRNRRSIYIHRTRGHRDPFFETFNQPGFDKSCEIRDSSTVTPQALTLFNSEETADRALAFAARVINETNDDPSSVRRIFELAYGRTVEREELVQALAFLKQAVERQKTINYEPRKWPTEITRRAIDELSGKPFTFRELLVEYNDYQPDLQPHQVDARTRGLADLCLAIFNSNEFAYID